MSERAAAAAIPGRWIGYGLGATIAAFVLLMWRAGLTIDPTAASCRPFYVFGASVAGLRLGLAAPATPAQRIVRDAAAQFGVFVALVLMGAVACYPVAALSHGFVDHALDRADAAIGFHWMDWYLVVAAHPSLQAAGRAFYESIYVSPAAIIVHHAVTDRQDRARAFVATFWLAAVTTLLLFRFMPAVGPLAYDWPILGGHGAMPYLPSSELWQPMLIPALREHAVHRVDLGQLRGLVSAPSFHAAAAVLFVVAAWPLGALRWPLTVVNIGMLIATPVEGTHYLTDILLGMAVAGGAILVVRRVVARLDRGEWMPVPDLVTP